MADKSFYYYYRKIRSNNNSFFVAPIDPIELIRDANGKRKENSENIWSAMQTEMIKNRQKNSEIRRSA